MDSNAAPEETRQVPSLNIEVTPFKSGSSNVDNPNPSPSNIPISPVTPINSPQKLAARFFLVFFTFLYAMEVVLWFMNNEFNYPHYFDYYSSDSTNIQIPQVLAPMSAQAVFTHFMIHVEKIYVNSNPRDPQPILPEPELSWHPFINLRTNQWSTLLLKFHFVLHNSLLVITLIGCILYGKMENSFDTIMQILVVPLMYRFFTLMVTTIRLRHDTLELEKMAEHCFSFGLGTSFICMFLASETFGCFLYDADAVLRDDPAKLADLSNFDYGPRKCFSTLYGNYMLSYNALFANVAYVLLYWLVDSDFQIIGLMRLKLPQQYTIAFIMQTVASVVFIFFFSQKEFPTERIDRWWPYSKTLYMGLWGFSFFVLGYKNIPSHAEIGFSSNFFSERHMLVIWDPKDKESFREKYLRTMASDMDTKKISKETDALNKELAEAEEYDNEDTDITLGAGDNLHVTKRSSKPGETKVIQKLSIEKEDEGEETLGHELVERSEKTLGSDDLDLRFEDSAPRPSSPVMRLQRKIKSKLAKASWLHRSIRVKEALAKGVTSKKMFVLRFVLMSFSYGLLALTISMILSFDFYKKFIWEMLGALSFCSVCVHYSIMVSHPTIYSKNTYLELKPLWEEKYINGRHVARAKFRFDRLAQVLVSPKLQYYLHNYCVFGWRVVAAFVGVDDRGAVDVAIAIVSFGFAMAIYYYIIRRMCAALRQRMEPGYTKDDGIALKEKLFLDGMTSLAVTIFFVFEVFGCVLQVKEDPELQDENDLQNICGLYKMANSCMAITLVFLQIMNHLTFSEMSGVELFSFKMQRYHLASFFITLVPCYASAFLFSRREQVDSLDFKEIEFLKQPSLYMATKIGGTFFSFIWLLILFVLGRKAKRVRDYDFVASDIAAIKDKFATDEDDEYSPDEAAEITKERKSTQSWGKLKENREAVVAAVRGGEGQEGKEAPAQVLKRGRAVSAITKFKKNQKVYEGRKETHKRLWILKLILFLGTVLYFVVSVLYLIDDISKTDAESTETYKGMAYIVQPLSFACCMMHYFCDIDIENGSVKISKRMKFSALLGTQGRGSTFEYVHIFLHIVAHTIFPMVIYGNKGGAFLWNAAASLCLFFLWLYFLFLCRLVRIELDKKHKTLQEIEKTLERFFSECFAALLVIIYVSMEASGCIEGAEDLHSECTSYLVSARIFATTMAVPLVLYVATFVADLSAYDLMVNSVNPTLGLGLFATFLAGGVSVFTFAIRTWTFDPSNLPLYYTLNFIDFWEVFMFASLNLVLRGVVKDCQSDALDNNDKFRVLETLSDEVAEVERDINELERTMQAAVDDGNVEIVDKLSHTYSALKISKKEMKNREAALKKKSVLTKQEANEALHRNKAKIMRRHSIIAEKNLLTNEGDTESQLRHCRIIRQLNEPDLDDDLREREYIRTKFGSHDGQDSEKDGEGVHYRANRGSRISSNYLGLIV